MTTTTECPHGFADPAWCYNCKAKLGLVPEDPGRFADSFEARFEARCAAGCGDRIKPGDMIVGNSGGYYHDECAY